MKNAPAGRIRSRKKRSFARRGARALTAVSAPTPRPARSWARRPTCRPSRPAATSPTSTAAPTSSRLGAILCEILTGKPPYLGRSAEEVRRKAANGDLADATARLDACGADAELIALTKKCLAPEAIDRPKDAQAVADGLSAYLDGVQERLQTAERERAVAMVREAEERKRRKVQLALAASVALLLLGGGAVAWWQNVQAGARRETDLRRQLVDEQRAAADNARHARNAEAVAALLGQAEEALKAGDAAKAAVVLEAAKKRSAEGGAENEAKRLGRLDADLARAQRPGRRRPVPLDRGREQAAGRRGRGDADPGRAEAVRGRPRRGLGGRRGGTGVGVGGAGADRLGPGSSAAAREDGRRLRALAPAGGCRPVSGRGPGRGRSPRTEAKFAELAGQQAAVEQPPGFVAFLGESGAIPWSGGGSCCRRR